MAKRATDLREYVRASLHRRGEVPADGRRQKAHERGEKRDIVGRAGFKVKAAFGSGCELASGSLIALLREQVIGNAVLNVVRFTGKDVKRLVLRLPTKASDRSVIPAGIELSGNA